MTSVISPSRSTPVAHKERLKSFLGNMEKRRPGIKLMAQLNGYKFYGLLWRSLTIESYAFVLTQDHSIKRLSGNTQDANTTGSCVGFLVCNK